MRLRLMIPTAAVLTMLSGSQLFAAPIVVACGAGQRAIIGRRTACRNGESSIDTGR